jgi:RecB family exonuclease
MDGITAEERPPRIDFIRSVSPSRATALERCRLSEAFRAAGTVNRLPTHPKAHFGILVHDFLRRAQVGAFVSFEEVNVRKEWNKAVLEYEKKLADNLNETCVVPLSASCDDFEVESRRVVKAACFISPPSGKKPTIFGSSQSHLEIPMTSKDGLITGRADRILKEGMTTVVSDLKTGRITDASGRLRPDLLLQVLLYSYLWHETTHEWPSLLRITSIEGTNIELQLSPKDAEEAAARLKSGLSHANELIQEVRAGLKQETDLATPSPEACRLCLYRPSCSMYWKEKSLSLELSWPKDVRGDVSEIKNLGRNLCMAELTALEQHTIMIRGIPAGSLIDVVRGDAVAAYSLKSERAPGVFSWRQTSKFALSR